MRTLLLLMFAFCAMASGAVAQTPDSLDRVAVFSRDGHSATLADIVAAAAEADVVFLGELHDDSLGHVVQAHLLRAMHEAYARQRPLLLGMEMFETDVQGVLDEYASGVVRERDMLSAARPWPNYDPDYRRLVEFSVANGIPVIGTNAPKRYVSAVSREGNLDVLGALAPASRATMPAEIVPPSEPLAEAFRALMGDMGSHGAMPGMPSVDGMLAAQNLRDATMAWALVGAMDRAGDQPLAIHVNGSFHSASGMGIPEHIAHLAPEARILVVTMTRTSGDLPAPGANDFVVVTPGAE